MKEEYAYPDYINKDNVYYLNPNDLDDINEENLFLAFINNNLNVLASIDGLIYNFNTHKYLNDEKITFAKSFKEVFPNNSWRLIYIINHGLIQVDLDDDKCYLLDEFTEKYQNIIDEKAKEKIIKNTYFLKDYIYLNAKNLKNINNSNIFLAILEENKKVNLLEDLYNDENMMRITYEGVEDLALILKGMVKSGKINLNDITIDEYLENFKNKAYDDLDKYWYAVFNSKNTFAHFIASINGHIYDFSENQFINLNRISINYAISLNELAPNCHFSLSYNEAGKLICLNIAEDMIDLLAAFQTIDSETVDKLAKIGEDGVIKELEELNINKDKLDKLFSYFKLDIDTLINNFKDSTNEILREGISEIEELQIYIDKFNLNECVFTPYLARGLEIYTGTIWEVFDKQKRITSSIGAGGRYDKIITNFIDDGNVYPAVGMTFGLVPIYEIMSLEKKNSSVYDLYIIPMDTKYESLLLAKKLRDNGVKVIIEMNNKKVKKAFEWANKNHIPFVTVIGETEINTEIIKIKNMNESSEKEVNINDINSILNIINKID